MSFFGFDATGPPPQRGAPGASESYDFENTYDGLGEQLDDADDALNDETFGGSGDIGKDFSFAKTTNSAAQAPPPTLPQGISYAQAASRSTNDEEFMNELWGSSVQPNNAPQQQQHQQQPQTQQPMPEKKILSLQEIEAQLTAIDQGHQQPQMQQFPPQFGMPGMMPPQFGIMPPNGFMPPPVYGNQFPMGPPHMMGQPFMGQMMPGQHPQGMPGQHPQSMPGQPQPQVPQQQHQQVPQQAPQQQPIAQQPQPVQPVQPQQVQEVQQVKESAPVPAVAAPVAPVAQSTAQPTRKSSKPADFSQFPVLGSKGNAPSRPVHRQQFDHQQGHQQGYHRQHLDPTSMTPEQKAEAARRQEKVSRIMRYSGIMNPKDKDFVTRFQLSQFVTEDPYTEDFYAQVYKVIHPKQNQIAQQQEEQNNSIAQAYLDQSGHRLGGRHQRADVALQRMQQQVQRAVSVAKERPKLTQFVREGALGKISIGTGKQPRRQLELFSKAVQQEIEKEATEESRDGLNVQKLNSSMKKAIAPSGSNEIKKYTRKDIMSILENIITQLMSIESESRLSPDVDTSELWEALKILEQTSPKVNDESEINPFIQCLNHEKALKIVTRLFKFLSREQVLTIATLIMSNLQNLSVIKDGSYTKYEDKKIPNKINSLIETHSLTFTKVFMNAVQDFKFNEIIGLLVILIEHNNVSFVSTTKAGLSLLTTLLSRAELIRGEGTISATDLSEWSSCYDELFTSLESRISGIFPPNHEEEANESYVWQFLATLALGGKLNHQRIIVDEVRDQIFSVMNQAKALNSADPSSFYKKQNLLNNLNMFLVVMGLVADENEIKELQG